MKARVVEMAGLAWVFVCTLFLLVFLGVLLGSWLLMVPYLGYEIGGWFGLAVGVLVSLIWLISLARP